MIFLTDYFVMGSDWLSEFLTEWCSNWAHKVLDSFSDLWFYRCWQNTSHYVHREVWLYSSLVEIYQMRHFFLTAVLVSSLITCLWNLKVASPWSTNSWFLLRRASLFGWIAWSTTGYLKSPQLCALGAKEDLALLYNVHLQASPNWNQLESYKCNVDGLHFSNMA